MNDVLLAEPRERLPFAPLVSPPEHALAWVRACQLPTGGLRMHFGHPQPYPEVTGYWIPTLLRYGERPLAARLARWLLTVQRADGAFPGHNPEEGAYIFDTGQILRGLLASMELVPQARDAALRAADALCHQLLDQGAGGFAKQYDASGIPESIQLYVLPPLVRAAAEFERPEYARMAARCADFYLRQPYALRLGTLTHFLGYELEALLELGRTSAATAVLRQLRDLQAADGSVRALTGAKWVCTTGLAQIAVCWYRLGWWEAADKAMEWLDRHQLPKGGFLGSYGPGADYWPEHEPVWGVKYYLDAHRLRVRAYRERTAQTAPLAASLPATTDARVQALAQIIRPGDSIVELGCSASNTLRALQAIHANLQCTGVDVSHDLLAALPTGVESIKGSLEAVPCPDNRYDVALAVETLEQSASVEASVGELIRITRPGGTVVIIGQPQQAWGWRSCPTWERWPDAGYVQLLLEMGCEQVNTSFVSLLGEPANGRMLLWQGRKRPPPR